MLHDNGGGGGGSFVVSITILQCIVMLVGGRRWIYNYNSSYSNAYEETALQECMVIIICTGAGGANGNGGNHGITMELLEQEVVFD